MLLASTKHLVPVGLISVFLAGSAAAASPEQIVSTAARLASRSLDAERSIEARGQVVEREGLRVVFEEGSFVPIVREDGRIQGALFSGRGTVEFLVPAGTETIAWQADTRFAPMLQEFTAAHLRFTDATLGELEGDQEWGEYKDPSGSMFRLFEARTSLLEHPEWTRWHPDLQVDQLLDLYGGGHEGGHLLAEFRTETSGWVSYLHNPRGALTGEETVSIFTATPTGTAPPEVTVLASFGESAFSHRRFDVASIDLDVAFREAGLTGRDLVGADVEARIDIVGIDPNRPVKAVVLELEPHRNLCNAVVDRRDLHLTRAIGPDGEALGAVHSGGRLFVALPTPLAYGEATTITLGYSGPLTQGLVAKQPDVYFSPIGPWAWYPRNPRPDRHGSTVHVHMPRYMRAVAPGVLTEERLENDGWHFTFEEPSGVRNVTLVVGDLVPTKKSARGANPEITVWTGSTEALQAVGSEKGARTLVDFISGIWGGYPYSALHVVENIPFPAANWSTTEEGSLGRWSCIPTGQVHPWQAFTEGPSGMVLTTMPTTSPSREVDEGRVIDRLLIEPLEPNRYLRIVDLTRQWWGHLVPAKTYRDTWIGEALAHWTGLVFVQSGVGPDAAKQRLKAMQTAMAQATETAQPLVHGDRLGRRYAAQVWGRAPLVVSWLVDRMGAQAFLQASQGLMRRSAGPGIDTAVLLEVLAEHAEAPVVEQLRRAVQENELPELQYNASIDKSSGEVVVVFQHQGAVRPVDVRIEVGLGGKSREQRLITVDEPLEVLRWIPKGKARRVSVDPTNTALVKSLKKSGSLTPDSGPAQ